MKAKIIFGGLVAALLMSASNASANADAYLFGYTYSPYAYGPQELIVNGSTTITADTVGWYDINGYHDPSNSDYIVGNCSINSCGGVGAYNNFATFNLSGVTGPITSAVLSLGNPSVGYSGAPSATYTTWDVSTSIANLNSFYNNSATGIYNDLGSGVSYGSVGVGPFDNGAQVNVAFNSAGLAALTAAEGNEFAVGGSLGTFTAGVPEPATWAMLALGLGLIGGGLRMARRKTAAALTA